MKRNNAYSIVGGSIWGNRGAEAMLVTTIGEIRQFNPDATFYVFSIYPKKDKTLTKDDKIIFLDGRPLPIAFYYFPLSFLHFLLRKIRIILPLPSNIKALRSSHCLLDMGGITFSDGRSLQLLYNVFSILPAMLLGTPVIKLSQAMGPFNKKLNGSLAKFLLPKCKHIFARGEITKKYLSDLKIDSLKYEQAPDIAFLYKSEFSLSEENEVKVNRIINSIKTIRNESSKKILSIIPSSLVLNLSQSSNIKYSSTLLRIIKEVCDDGYFVVILPNASRCGSKKPMNNDLIAINQLKLKAGENLSDEYNNNIQWIDYDINTKSVRNIISNCDAIITSRFHGMVAGLSLSVPTIVIGWSHKYQETLADFDLNHLSIDYNAKEEKTVKKISDYLSNLEIISNKIDNNIEEVRVSSRQQFDYIHNKYHDS
jgi:colanic acid/amylovoran biosynthesis protein